jgi:hypothetical protein
MPYVPARSDRKLDRCEWEITRSSIALLAENDAILDWSSVE